MKKALSFLLILLLVSMTAWFVLGDVLTAALFTGEQRQKTQYYALSQDDRGSVYYAANHEGVNKLTALDSSGNVLLSENMAALRDGNAWYIDSVFVASNHIILAAASRYERTQERVSEISLHCFYENGSYAGQLLSLECNQSPYIRGEGRAFLSAVSESSEKLAFGAYQDGRIRTYELDKGGSAEAVLSRDLQVTESINNFIVMPEQRVVCVTVSGDFLVYEPGSISGVKISAGGVIVDELYQLGSDAIYCRDARDGGVYRLSLDTRALTPALSGNSALDASGESAFNDLKLMHISSAGRVAGILEKGSTHRVVAGTELYMTTLTVSGEESGFESLLLVAGIGVGVLLLTVLIWDAYCRLLKMRLPIMLRQGLLIIAGVFTLIYLLLSLVVEPRMRLALTGQYESRIRSAAEVAAATVNDAPNPEAVESITRIGANAANTTDSMPPVHLDLFTLEGEKAYLLVSGDGMQPGTSVGHLKNRGLQTSDILNAVQAGSATLSVSEPLGERAYVLLALDQNRVLAASAGTERISENIDSITGAIISFLIIGGAALIALLLLIESITVTSLLRLKRGVDAVSAGNYDVSIRVHSGDEVENLANSFNTMTRLIRGAMQRLSRTNASAARFVPSNMVNLLNLGSVEDLDKGACVKARMTILLARFRFLESDGSESTEELFNNINQVMQALTSAVPENNGAVYDLQANGFNAVFTTNAADAIRAALKLRSNAEAFNEERRGAGLSTADVRIVLTVGDVMLGVVGDDTRLSPTAISDVIVSAGQIMEITEPSNIYICCTGALIEELRDYRSRYVGVLQTGRGGERIYDLYEGDPLALVKHKQMCAQMFDKAVAAFYARDFSGAKVMFMELIKLSLQDKTSVNYMYFADRYMREPPEQVSYHAMPR